LLTIIVNDDSTTKKKKKKKREKTDAVFFVYDPPSRGSQSIAIHDSDLALLEPKQWINDNIMNFYVRFSGIVL